VPHDPEFETESESSSSQSSLRRRASDQESALSDDSRGTWRLFVLIGSILGAAVSLIAVDRYLGVAWAQGVVAPIEKRVDVLEFDRIESRSWRLHMSRQMVALCKASTHPEACLTDN